MRKVAVVTGGARGIGRGCAHALAERGCDLVLVDLLAPEMDRTKAELEGMGAKVLTFEADVAENATAHRIAGEVDAAWGSRRMWRGWWRSWPASSRASSPGSTSWWMGSSGRFEHLPPLRSGGGSGWGHHRRDPL